jgi:hypothetical protein
VGRVAVTAGRVAVTGGEEGVTADLMCGQPGHESISVSYLYSRIWLSPPSHNILMIQNIFLPHWGQKYIIIHLMDVLGRGLSSLESGL